MKTLAITTLVLLTLSGCAATWNGIKEDTTSATDWTKRQVNDGATYVQEKTK